MINGYPPPPSPTPERIAEYYHNNPHLTPGSLSEPGFLQKAANFGRAITQHLAAGLPQADEATVAHRLSLCHVCEHFDAERTVCKICGCYLDIKIRWQEQKCPIERW